MRHLLLALAVLGSSAASGEELLLKGATVHTVSGETLAPGDVLVRDGRIAAVGASLDAPGATVVDLKGLHLYPGLIQATSSLGLTEIGAVRATNDTDEVGEYKPDVEAAVSVNPDSELIPVARANGLTHALVVPSGGVVTGQSALIRLDGWTWEDMTVRTPVALHVVWPGMGLSVTPPERRRPKDEWKPPEKQAEERRARLKELEEFFEEGRSYAKARAAGSIRDAQAVPAWEAMLPFLHNERPLMIHADDVRQIKAALAWAEAKKFTNLILAGGRDADLCAAQLAKQKVPVIWEQTFDQPARDTEPYDVHFSAPGRLQAAGVTVVFSVGAGSWGAWSARNLPYHAAQAVAFGMPREEALRGITLYPARILGLGDRLGSIEVGKEASLIAVDGDILDIRANVKRMWIAGRETSLESRHTRL
ncbi:MAG: amidohydrolase family protein, partial [Planctomycetes bacterium]|nr:amidohydrolase family protein [Planctomycetota bacterium]